MEEKEKKMEETDHTYPLTPLSFSSTKLKLLYEEGGRRRRERDGKRK